MARRIVFVASVVLSLILILVLSFLKLNKRLEDDMNALIESSKRQNASALADESEDTATHFESNKEGLIKLADDETFITSVTTDINEDGLSDEIVAVKKLLNPSVYLILATQQSEKSSYMRLLEIKTNVTLPQSLFVYTIQLQNSLPAIVCEGMGANKEKKLSIYLIKEVANSRQKSEEDADVPLAVEAIGQFSANIQIQMQDRRTTTIGQLEDYSIETYSLAEPSANTSSQIRREYQWDASVARFLKVGEETIKAKKEEDSRLKNLKNASIDTYRKHLSGLWYMPRTVGENARYLYYDKKANHFIFHIGNVQEIFDVSNMFARRLGVSVVTVNTAIPTIKRRIEVEIDDAEEVQLKVTEDVATLRINTASPWSGRYRKKQNTFSSLPREVSSLYKELKDIIHNSVGTWASEEGTLKINNATYHLKIGKREEKGFLNLMELYDKCVIEMKSLNNEKSLFLAELLYDESENTAESEPVESKKDEAVSQMLTPTLSLTPATLTFAKLEAKGKPIMFTELRN